MEALLIVENLEKRYESAGRLRSKHEAPALQGVSFSIASHSTLALVGESGSGKSTLAFCIACLERPTSGSIKFNGIELTALEPKQLLGATSADSAGVPRSGAIAESEIFGARNGR